MADTRVGLELRFIDLKAEVRKGSSISAHAQLEMIARSCCSTKSIKWSLTRQFKMS